MQARYRSSGDGARSYSSGYRSFGRGGYSRGPLKSYAPPPPPPPPPLPPPRKADILLAAGRLAAEYLVSQGLLPPSSQSGKQTRGFEESKAQDREPPRTSALSRLESSVSNNHGRRFDDEHNHAGSRWERRRGPYDRSYASDWGIENGRNDHSIERSSRYSDDIEGKDEFVPRYHQERQSGFDDCGSSVSRVGGDERQSKSESGSENNEVVEDTGSKVSSSSTRNEQLPEVDVAMSEEHEDDDDDAKAVNLDNGVDVKSVASREDKELGLNVNIAEGDSVGKRSNDLLKLCSFARVPTRPRSSLAQGNDKVEQARTIKQSDENGLASRASKAIAVEEHIGQSTSDLHTDQDKKLKCEPPRVISTLPHQTVEEAGELQNELKENPPGFETLHSAVEKEDASFEQDNDKRDGIKRKRDLTEEDIPQEDDCSSLNCSSAKRASPFVEKIRSDEVMRGVIDHEESAVAVSPSRTEAATDFELEEEKQFDPTSFKTFDLNLMEAPEITEIPDDPVMKNLQAAISTVKPEEEAPSNFGLSISNGANACDMYSAVSVGDKGVTVIDLEHDSPMGGTCGSSKQKYRNEMMYSGLESFLNHAHHAEDLRGIEDGYSLAISELIGSDIPGCPTVPADLNNLQEGLGLHGAEGVPEVDDSVYVSFGELPLGFIWDQPPQEFGKFF